MKTTLLTLTAAMAIGGAAFADGHASGDAAAGEDAFKNCTTCHWVQDADGNDIVGKKKPTGPNLYNVVGNAIAQSDYRYSKLMKAGTDAGLVWDEASFVAYVQDPTGYLKEATGGKGRSKMSYKVRKEEDAVNIYAYLASLAPAN